MRFYSYGAVLALSTPFFLWGRRRRKWVTSRSVGGALAGSFAALNLTHYLIECYTEVRRLGGHWTSRKAAKFKISLKGSESQNFNR